MRYYYKDNNNYYSLKSERTDLTPITKEEFDDHIKSSNNQYYESEHWKNFKRIEELKYLLRSTDYQAIKYAEGELSLEEYKDTKEQRKKWREEINILESKEI